MKRRTWFIRMAMLGLLSFHALSSFAQTPSPTVLKVMTHDSFDLPAPLLKKFEQDHHVRLDIIKGGDAGIMLNKLILTAASPIADVVYGLDNTLLPRATKANIIDTALPPWTASKLVSSITHKNDREMLQAAVIPVDYGFVTFNIDKKWFAQKRLPLPRSLEELTQAPYRGLVVMPHAITSSTGQAFLMATLAKMGEKEAFEWWAKMRKNELKVVKDWTQAYYTEFSAHGGKRPIVVSYATSPAAEVFYSKKKKRVATTANLFLEGGVFRQVEGVAILRGIEAPQRQAALQWIEFLHSSPVQTALQTHMWMHPVMPDIPADPIMEYANIPSSAQPLSMPNWNEQQIQNWQQQWVQVVLK